MAILRELLYFHHWRGSDSFLQIQGFFCFLENFTYKQTSIASYRIAKVNNFFGTADASLYLFKRLSIHPLLYCFCKIVRKLQNPLRYTITKWLKVCKSIVTHESGPHFSVRGWNCLFAYKIGQISHTFVVLELKKF